MYSARLTVIDISSAIGKDSQTSSSFPVREKRYATGRRMRSWRAAETIAEYLP